MMKAMVYHTYGTPDVLRMEEVEKPTPKENEVLIKVHASSVNSWDWDLLRGKPFLTRIDALREPKYKILGADVAGVVEAIGANVKLFQPGDEVFGDLSGCSWGAFAEYVCAREDALALKPAGMSFVEAAATPQAGVLALQGLRHNGEIQPGQKVLLNGAGGGVGTFALQMAKSSGAEITCVDSAPKLEMLRAIGADHVLDYRQVDFTKSGQRYDLILDVVVNRSIFAYQRALSPSGRFVVIGGTTPRILQVIFLGPLLSMLGSQKLGLLLHRPDPADLKVIGALFEAGKIKPIVDRVYPLREVPEAVRYLGEGHANGKVVITLEES